MKETEAIINSRPLVYVGDDINSGTPLTPAHFLSLNPNIRLPNFAPEDDYDINFNPKVNSAETLIAGWKKGLKHLDKFWQVWRNEYLLSLRERIQTKLKSPRVQTPTAAKVGHIVLIKDNLPRGCWRIGRITELISSRDQHVRSAKVLLPSNKIIGRPLNLLYPIEGFQQTLYDMLAPPQTSSPLSLPGDGINQIQNQIQQLSIAQHSNFHSSSIKLPQLEIPTFSGDKMRWKEFWDTFEATVDNNQNLTNIEKLNYLNSKLMGEAKSAVSGIMLSNGNYSVAVTLLKERFGDVQSVVNCHYRELINITPGINSSKGLRLLYDQVEKHLRSLESLHQDVNQEVFISIITSKVPKDVLVQLEIQKGAKNKWTVGKLRDLLNDYVVTVAF